jgi:ribosomal protein L37E
MFKCTRCGTQSKSGEKPIKVVLEERDRVYPPDGHTQKKNDPTFGREIVREASLCRTCGAVHEEAQVLQLAEMLAKAHTHTVVQ